MKTTSQTLPALAELTTEEERVGLRTLEFFDINPASRDEPGRFDTSWGTKTLFGLGCCIRRIVEETSPAPVAAPDSALVAALRAMIERAEMRHPHFEKGGGLEILNAAKWALESAEKGRAGK